MGDSTTATNGLLMKILDVAEVLSVGRSTVYELISEGHLETVHIGRSVRITTQSVEALVERRRTRCPRPHS